MSRERHPSNASRLFASTKRTESASKVAAQLSVSHQTERGRELDAAHLQQGEQERQCRLGALVLVDPLGVQTVATAARGSVVERQLEVILTKEPREGSLRVVKPLLRARNAP